MKQNTKRVQMIMIPVLFVLLLFALTAVERGAEGAHIRTLFDALWYMLATLSTVGYGDLYPVTLAGRLIGLLLILMSAGVFALLVGTTVSVLTGKALPGLRLLFSGSRPVFWFSGRNPATLALASKIKEETPSALVFFEKEIDVVRAAKKGGCTAFFMQEDDADNDAAALDLKQKAPEATVYFRSSHMVEGLPEGVHVFHPEESVARAYWEAYPLCKEDARVVLIGAGKAAYALLEQALYVNVLSPGQRIRYDVFFPDTRFTDLHFCLKDAFDVCLDEGADVGADAGAGADVGVGADVGAGSAENAGGDGRDLLVFHTVPFEKRRDVLEHADRLILCRADGSGSGNDLHTVKTFFPVTGEIHVLSDNALPGVTCFGALDEMMAPDRVMRMRDQLTARRLNHIYEEAFGSEHVPFASLSPFLQRSNLASADHLAVKLRLLLKENGPVAVTQENCARAYRAYLALDNGEKTVCRKIEHLRWCRFHTVNNWRHAPERDNERRLHPALVPFDDLPLREQEKDDISWEVIGKI